MMPRPLNARCRLRRARYRTLMAIGLAVTLAPLRPAPLWAAARYVVLPTGKRVEGKRVEADENGQIRLTVDTGVLTFDRGTRVVMDEPPDLARALQMMQRGDDREAARILRKTAEAYAFLEWDKKALRLLGRAQLNAGDAAAAAATYGKLLVVDPSARQEADVMTRYLKALADAGDEATLAPLLLEMIHAGPRPAAAQAQMIRGRLLLSKGETRLALMDFMRTAELFEAETELHKEALLLTADCLDILGDLRSDTYRKRTK